MRTELPTMGPQTTPRQQDRPDASEGFIEVLPEALVVVDREGFLRRINSTAAALLDAEPEAAKGRRLDEFLLPGETAGPDLLLARILADPGSGLEACLHRPGDGSSVPIEISGGRSPGDPSSLILMLRDLRRQKAQDEALARSEDRLRTTESLAHLGSFEMVYPGPGPGHWSDEIYRILGMEAGTEIADLDALFRQVVHPDDQPRVTAALRTALEEGTALNVSYRIRRSDGSVRHVRTSARLTPADSAAQWRVTGTLLDVTEQVRYEQALRAERDRAAAYINLVAMIVVAVDNHGNITLLNEQGLRILGCREEEVLGRNFFDLFMPEENRERAKRRFAYNLASRDDGPVREEGWIETCGRGRRMIRWRNKRLTDARGQVVGLLGAGEDVTEQRAIAQQLSRAEEELRLTFKHAPIGMATLTLEGDILDVNQSFCNMMTQPEDSLVGKPLASLLHPDERSEVERVRNRLIADEVDTLREELRFVRPDGSVRHGVVRYSLVRDARHRPIMAVAQIVDRSERIKAETELQQHRERLAHVARLGTMGEMAASIAHELNQPLTAISNYAQACQRMLGTGTIPAEELKQVLGKITSQAQRAGQVIQGLRNFVKRRSVSLRPLDIDQLLSDVMMLADVDTRNHGIPLRLESDSHLPPVQADPVQIQQVLLNLIRNAVDAMQGRDNRLEGIVLEARAGLDDEVVISVSDRGPGVSDEQVQRLFEPFFTTKPDGMGMGLSLSRTIAEAHGGRLDFTPRPGGGTIFTLRLPTLPED